ncbi:MAG: alkaline phosphatase family protein [Syntrophaceae bacterium]|nr:alkaline phosphatase family protein [Syntrophaceae bacterium]
MSTHRTLIIGLDGATFDLIHPWVQAGQLPTFAKLMSQGVYAPLKAWPNLNSAAAWSSIVTGYNPGQHGIFNFVDALPQIGTTWQPSTAMARKKDPFWRYLSAAGKRIGVINVPITYPADPIHGFMLSGMDTPDIHSPGFAHPPELCDELQRQGIDYVIDVPRLQFSEEGDPYQVPRAIQRMMDTHSRTILHLMKNRPWDTLMAVLVVTDRIQHFRWPAEGISFDQPDWAPIFSIYQQIDSFLGKALELIDDKTTVLIISDHGFGPLRLARRCLNQLFAQLGLLSYRSGADRLTNKLLERILVYGRKTIPFSFQKSLAKTFPGLHRRAIHEHELSSIDWSTTKVFYSPHMGTLTINLKGREPEGIVSVEDYNPLRKEIQEILLNVTDPVSGQKIIQAVHLREEIFQGPYLAKAPDLVIEWNYDVARSAICYPAEKEPFIIHPPKRFDAGERWTGDHRPYGIFIVCGPDIKRGSRVSNATLYDIAPTILYLQDHPIPNDMDGKVLTEIFDEDYLSHHPIQYREMPEFQWEASHTELGTEETQKIEERLRGLGYIE